MIEDVRDMIFKKTSDLSEANEKRRILKTQSQKLRNIQQILKARDEEIFKLCSEAMINNEEERAKIYANELSKIRGISQFLNKNLIIIECMTIRLETYVEFKNFVMDMKLNVNSVRSISKLLSKTVPQFCDEIQLLNSTISDMLTRATIDISKVPTIITPTTPETESIMKEVSSLLQDNLESCFPEPPVFKEEYPEEQGQMEKEAVPLASALPLNNSETSISQFKGPDFFDDILFDYLMEHGGMIDLVRCSNDLNLSYEEIRRRLDRLKKLGKIEIEED